MLDTSVQPIEESSVKVDARAALTSTPPAAEKTVDSMSASELEEVVTCVRKFVTLQSSNSGAVASVDVASAKAASNDTAESADVTGNRPMSVHIYI